MNKELFIKCGLYAIKVFLYHITYLTNPSPTITRMPNGLYASKAVSLRSSKREGRKAGFGCGCVPF